MTWQIFFWVLAGLLFVIAGVTSFRAWVHHWALACFGLASLTVGFLIPLLP